MISNQWMHVKSNQIIISTCLSLKLQIYLLKLLRQIILMKLRNHLLDNLCFHRLSMFLDLQNPRKHYFDNLYFHPLSMFLDLQKPRKHPFDNLYFHPLSIFLDLRIVKILLIVKSMTYLILKLLKLQNHLLKLQNNCLQPHQIILQTKNPNQKDLIYLFFLTDFLGSDSNSSDSDSEDSFGCHQKDASSFVSKECSSSDEEENQTGKPSI